MRRLQVVDGSDEVWATFDKPKGARGVRWERELNAMLGDGYRVVWVSS